MFSFQGAISITAFRNLVGSSGLEPPTSRLSGVRSNHLSYNFGLNLDAAWKGFDIKVFFQGTLKRDYAAGGAVFWGAIGTGKWQ